MLAILRGLQCRQLMKNGSGNGERIELVLIEDRPNDVKAILDTLKKANLCNRIHVLNEGAKVLDFLLRTGEFSKQPPLPHESLILLSLTMGNVNGLDLLRKIKSDERTKSLPVIMLTGSQEDRGVMQSYKLGANACIVKPIDFPKLIEAVAELRLWWLLVSKEEHPK